MSRCTTSILQCNIRRRKGMELSINTIVILVVLLVLVVLILVSRGGSNFTDFGGEKIGIAGDVSECERLCWECCRGDDESCDDFHFDPNEWRDCGCKINRENC